jgi:hypothetical protein
MRSPARCPRIAALTGFAWAALFGFLVPVFFLDFVLFIA